MASVKSSPPIRNWVAERIAPSQRIEISVTREPILTMRALWTLRDETAAAATAA